MALSELGHRIDVVNGAQHFLVLRRVQSHLALSLVGMFAKESYLFTVKTQFNLQSILTRIITRGILHLV